LVSELKSLEKAAKKINTSDEEKSFVKVGSLKQGDTFGELALISVKGVRNATIIAERASCFGVLSESVYNSCLKQLEEEKIERLIEFIQSMPCFSQLTRGAVMKIVKSLTKIQCVKNQFVT
jgi:hypothetical protein